MGTGKWLGTGDIFTLVDTPGFGDSQGEDYQRELFDEMINVLKNDLKDATTLILLIKGTETRFNAGFQKNIELMVSLFGDKMWENVIVAVSFWYHDSYHREGRKWPKPGSDIIQNEEWFADTWSEQLRKKFKIPKDVKLEFVFIDSQSQLDRNMNQEDQQEIFRNETNRFWELQADKESFKFRTIDDVLRENNRLKDEINKAEAILEKYVPKLEEDDIKELMKKFEDYHKNAQYQLEKKANEKDSKFSTVTAELQSNVNYYARQAAKWKKKYDNSGCVLGDTTILMADFSSKPIEDIQVNDVILDGNLNKVNVVHVIKHYLSSTKLFQFYPDGPVFTADHQFLLNLETQNVGVVSKDYLFKLQPQMEEFGEMVHEFKYTDSVLQYENGSISSGSFEIVPFDKEMDQHTLMYALITSGDDGTYIAGNFVSRDVLPDIRLWPWTYGTLGIILNNCKIDFPSTLNGQKTIVDLTSTLTDAWRIVINNFENNFKASHYDGFMFDPLAQSESGIKEILANEKKMIFGQYLQASSSKLLHQTLDAEDLPKNRRFSLIKLLLKEVKKHLLCNEF